MTLLVCGLLKFDSSVCICSRLHLESRGTIIEGGIVHEGSTQDDLAVWSNGPSFLGASLHNLSWLSGRFSALKNGGIERHDNGFTTLNTLTRVHTHYQWLVHAPRAWHPRIPDR